jgi:hypothetical protein
MGSCMISFDANKRRKWPRLREPLSEHGTCSTPVRKWLVFAPKFMCTWSLRMRHWEMGSLQMWLVTGWIGWVAPVSWLMAYKGMGVTLQQVVFYQGSPESPKAGSGWHKVGTSLGHILTWDVHVKTMSECVSATAVPGTLHRCPH